MVEFFYQEKWMRREKKLQKWLGDKGVRSVKNAVTIKGQSNFKNTAKIF